MAQELNNNDHISDEYNSNENVDALYEKLINTVQRYHPSKDVEMIRKAYLLAESAHRDQRRRSGEPYIIHPLWVAIILAELELDKESIIAGLLHDVVEDTEYTEEQIVDMFGEEVALLVDGVTKLGQLNYTTDKIEMQAENLRKMFLAMAKDIRVILIKLADRLHNMRTMQFMPPHKQIEKSKETLEVYAPIAQRLGISKIKIELEDLAFKYVRTEIYKEIEKGLNEKEESRQEYIDGIISNIREKLDETDLDYKIYGRVKHYFSIFRKMVNQDKSLDEIYDIFAIRILVNTVRDCYAVLGVIHDMYTPIPGRFKDYIAMPKPNMYQSLHTTLIGPLGQPFEVQIRTYEMHRTAEYGIAAHWKYKESGGSDQKAPVDGQDAKLTWLREILEWQQETNDNKEFLSFIKGNLNLFSENVYCFTPQGEVKQLPAGSTPVDFAYLIHSAIGNTMVGARVNNKLVPIDYRIQNGDRIQIMTSSNSKGPSRDWLKIVASTQAKNKIMQWFKREFKEENIIKGKELLQNYCKTKGVVFSDINRPDFQKVVQRKYGYNDWNAVLAAVGHGALKEGQVINRLLEEQQKKIRMNITDEDVIEGTVAKKKSQNSSGVVVKGIHDVTVRFSRCCNPVPGDEIIGFVTRGRGITIHRTDCENLIHMPVGDRERLITAEWQAEAMEGSTATFNAELKIFCNNRRGLVVDISREFTERSIDINFLNARKDKKGHLIVEVTFDVHTKNDINVMIQKIRQISDVIDIERTVG
ncbi:MAG: bifunctional (p)ppGpp synthetase/guanosine-3',5'-bis(diphosphate) 3'-pyrophosphohydrolase [Clostridiales bacterium]|nr:bifunctional (p)ppGpp synthetase/guanosine-3',5'-bis(diphosphate) 3'-pyrophosphohydrolase [Clostridiales bacterium]